MPLKLNVGLARKVGQPDYGSLSASCHLEVELDQSLLTNDLDGFHTKVKQAFIACNQAVKDELHRQANNGEPASSAPRTASNGNGSGHSRRSNNNGNGQSNGSNGNGRSKPRPATASQVRALHAIANKQSLDLEDLLTQRFQVATPDDLSITQASDLIDELNTNHSGA